MVLTPRQTMRPMEGKSGNGLKEQGHFISDRSGTAY